MKQFSYETTRDIAAHAKILDRLMSDSARFASLVTFSDGKKIHMKSADLLNEGIRGGSMITVSVEGRDEEAAVAAIQNYVVAYF